MVSRLKQTIARNLEIRYKELCHHLHFYREKGFCAMGDDCLGKLLTGLTQRVSSYHHIQKRSHGRIDEPWNLLGICAYCHEREENRYAKYPPKGQEFCFAQAMLLNKLNHIPDI